MREHPEARRARREELPARTTERGGDESPDERTEAERRREEPEAFRADVERVAGEKRDENVEVEANRADDRDDGEDGSELRLAANVRECPAHAFDDASGRVALDLVELVGAKSRERYENREEAEGVDDEADAGAGKGDDDAGDRRSDHARSVEEAGVQCHCVRQRARSDHLIGERLPSGRVEGEGDPAERREDIDDRERRGPGQRDHGERNGDDQRCSLRRHDELSRVHAVGDDAGSEAEDGERNEAAERECADCQGRSRELEHQPRERDVLHPRAGQRDELSVEEDPIVPMAAEAAERARAKCDRE